MHPYAPICICTSLLWRHRGFRLLRTISPGIRELINHHRIRKSEGVLLEECGGRPHVIYNPTTQKYVLWHNLDTGYSVATSSSPNAPFTGVGVATLDPQFAGLQPADHSVNVFGMIILKSRQDRSSGTSPAANLPRRRQGVPDLVCLELCGPQGWKHLATHLPDHAHLSSDGRLRECHFSLQ